ncbi:MAG: hypothetical protein AAFZ15_31730 [Bacteroidota bacterium]
MVARFELLFVIQLRVNNKFSNEGLGRESFPETQHFGTPMFSVGNPTSLGRNKTYIYLIESQLNTLCKKSLYFLLGGFAASLVGFQGAAFVEFSNWKIPQMLPPELPL